MFSWKAFLSCAFLLNSFSSVSLVEGLKDLPSHAKGGRIYKEIQSTLYRQVGAQQNTMQSEALSWPAKVDNFNDRSNDTFQQRYFVDESFYNGKGPVFFEIGGEGTLSGAPGGYIAKLAEKYNALLVALEHRFYGESIPMNSVDTETYHKYLTVDQALKDLDSFTHWYTKERSLPEGTKWFVFGGSYPGALSSWYRNQYPQSSVGSLSSSGVVNCIVDYYQFDEQVTAAVGNQCSDRISEIQKSFEKLILDDNGKDVNEEGWKIALDMFNCEYDMWKEDFYYMMADSWSMADQYAHKESLCNAILDVATDGSTDSNRDYNMVLMQTFANYTKELWGANFCTGGFYNSEQLRDPKRWKVDPRSWRWQTCSEVSYFNTAPERGSLRSTDVNLEYHLKQCNYIFGGEYYQGFPTSYALNKKFGGDLPTAHKVFYSDFSDDPWQRASVNYKVSSDQPYRLAMGDGLGHCQDFHEPSDKDPQVLVDLREEFETYLDLWLNESD